MDEQVTDVGEEHETIVISQHDQLASQHDTNTYQDAETIY